ncbi:LysM peptidoglycan-binding domain-containing protein [Streptomyces sp. SCSIO ZS0520]|uniref:LysM peptidoglycan-binding domain-containing protein n=1 Tax=Streptomyces sp. SCSIO ZS0520 TaxID=2892996 RepID=UPI0021D81C2E|nr:LysM peptidoglycan-binding domain-containing protein [Streptomyces sp. SCSIO ZS0520]
MLSGNGRHRRPRQAPAFVVTAGVTGSALALPLLAGTSAHAADKATWDRLADCESGGAWSANEGNGHYGGLQLTQRDWESYGGLDFAARPDLASRSQQIAVGQKLLDDKGPAAWLACAAVAELTGGGPEPSVDPGVPDSSSPKPSDSPKPDDGGEPSGSPSPSGSGGDSDKKDDPNPSDSADPTDSAGSADPSGSPSESDESGEKGESGAPEADPSATPEDSATPGDGDGKTGDEGDSGTDRGNSPGSGGGSGSGGEGSGRHRGEPAPDADVPDRPGNSTGRHSRPGDSPAAGDGSYSVRPGDSLSMIAEAQDVDGGWPALYALNKETVGADPDLILPGQSLALASETDAPQG